MCNGNKVLQTCYNTSCPRTCDDVQNDNIACHESHECTTVCSCLSGYIEDADGNCVEQKDCCNIGNAKCNEW